MPQKFLNDDVAVGRLLSYRCKVNASPCFRISPAKIRTPMYGYRSEIVASSEAITPTQTDIVFDFNPIKATQAMRKLAESQGLNFDGLVERAGVHFGGEKPQPKLPLLSAGELSALADDDEKAAT